MTGRIPSTENALEVQRPDPATHFHPNQASAGQTTYPASAVVGPLPDTQLKVQNTGRKRATNTSPKRPLSLPSSRKRVKTGATHSRSASQSRNLEQETHSMSSPSRNTASLQGGGLPLDIGPRVSPRQGRPEDWQRCKSGVEAAQQTLMSLDHGRGALEYETERLREDVALMWDEVARQQATLRDAVARVERLAFSS
ncbi:hypothetical protein VTK56DRAFT_1702 [Thermocarpiscus australiensis]